MNEIIKKISFSKKLSAEGFYGDMSLYVEYSDPDGNEEKKNLIENLINKTLDEAKRIMDS